MTRLLPIVQEPPRGPQRIATLIAAVVGACATVALTTRYQRPEPTPDAGPPGITTGSDWVSLDDNAPQWAMVRIETASAGTAAWSSAIPARVTFDERRTTRVGAPLPGRVTRVFVERGQRVKRGDSLFTVSSQSLAELRGDLDKALVQRAAARNNLERTEALVESQNLPGKELVAARQADTEAAIALQLAQQKLAALQIAPASTDAFTVRAPRDGIVVESNLALGQELDPGAGTAMAIAELSKVWVVADIFEGDHAQVIVGTRAKVLVGEGASLERGIDGAVEQVSAIVDPDRHAIPVRVAVDNADAALRPNARVQLRFALANPARVELPAEAVLSDGASSYVYVQDGRVLRRHPITLGPLHDGRASVIAGLEPGARVVTRGAILLDNQIQLDH